MRIKKLTAANYGRHAKVDFDCDGAVVGLVGPNGSGKSTLLHLLSFLVTGESDDPAPTYVRNLEGNGSGELTFEKNGRKGVIFRQVGSTPKRTLEWDGKTYRAAKDVDRVMQEIFGADKKAISAAVFIKQGVLEGILFGDYAERRKMFIRVLNLAHCEQRARMVADQVRLLEQTIVDLTPALLEARRTLDTMSGRCSLELEALGQTPDLLPMLRLVQTSRTAVATRDTLAQQLSAADSEQMSRMQGLQALLQAPQARWLDGSPGTPSPVALLEQRISEQLRLKAALEDLAWDWRRHQQLTSDLQQVQVEITQRQQELAGMTGGSDTRVWQEQQHLAWKALEQELQSASLRNLQQNQAASLKTEVARQAGLREQANTALLKLHEDGIDENALSAAATSLNHDHGVLQFMERTLSMRERLGVSENCHDCPECGIKLADPKSLSAECLENHRRLTQEQRRKVQEQSRSLQEHQQTLRKWQVQHADAERLLAELVARLQEAEKHLAETAGVRPVEQLRAGMDDLQTKMRLVAGTQTRLEALQATARTHTEAMGQCAHVLREGADKAAGASIEVAKVVAGIDALQAELTAAKVFRQQYQNETTNLQQTVQRRTKLAAEFEAAYQLAKASHLEQLMVQFQVTTSEALELELQVRQDKRKQQEGALVELQKQVEIARQTVADLEKRQRADAGKAKLLEQLRSLRDLLLDSGLPARVVKHHFAHLTTLTQGFLREMNANFAITPDPDEDVSYQFIRLDTPDGVRLPMAKLSGGQRVRLCVSFLMAVQQWLVKDVGLLVLDEPTVHLDEEGIESLVDLLASMQQRLKNTDLQIWVCDHSPRVALAMEKVLTLNKHE